LLSKLSHDLLRVFALLLASIGTTAAALPAPFAAQYAGTKFPLNAKAQISLERFGDYYKYVLRGAVFLTFYKASEIYDCSVIEVRDGELYPLEYLHRDKRSSQHVRYDWPANTIRTTVGDGPVLRLEDVQPVVWDLMSIQVRLRADVPATRRGDQLEYAVVHKGEITRHRARNEGVEAVEAGEQVLQAVRVQAEDRKGGYTFWFAKDFGWLPIRFTLRGVTLELVSPPAQAGREPAPAAGVPTC
jgi:Protein of unknown function (DUF3108)